MRVCPRSSRCSTAIRAASRPLHSTWSTADCPAGFSPTAMEGHRRPSRRAASPEQRPSSTRPWGRRRSSSRQSRSIPWVSGREDSRGQPWRSISSSTAWARAWKKGSLSVSVTLAKRVTIRGGVAAVGAPKRRALAAGLGVYPNCRATSQMRRATSGEAAFSPIPPNTLETVDTETPAAAAISFWLAILFPPSVGCDDGAASGVDGDDAAVHLDVPVLSPPGE